MSQSTHARQGNGRAPSMRDEIDGLKETVRTGVHDAVEGGLQVAHTAGVVAKKKVAEVRRSAMDTRDTVAEKIMERPFTAVAIAAGVGAIVGVALMCKARR